MKRGIILSAFFLGLAFSTGLAYGQAADKETRDLRDFSKISFGIAGNLEVTIGQDFKVVLEGDKSTLDNIITDVTGGRLVIKEHNWRFRMRDKVSIYITMPALKDLSVSGSGRAEIKDALTTDNLGLSVSGSGRLYTAGFDVSNLSCSISGSGNIIPGNGNAAKGNISISGSGNYEGDSARIGILDVSISGSGNCRCNCNESLRARISGSGNVSYLGNPRIDARISGSGKVRSR